ncbi:tetratricopeptide repeat-containing diguanylate cyclase [Deinococcus hopiensis]|uniref:tetratricopeptide repeat-containing diguanylate cyclase n=1 Tax=Deinococcus hopiensis TaxID=309885 RepID=UPI0014832876|nr:tetratricopeptide repeat-containing diguanylate cyclase [Deinococcus hopiensis]
MTEIEARLLTSAQGALHLIAEAEALTLPDSPVGGQLLCLRGAALFYCSEIEASAASFASARALGQRLGDAALEARALNGLGNVASQRGDYVGTLEHFLESARLAGAVGDEQGRLRVLNNIGVIRGELGEYEEALRTHREVIEGTRRIGDPLLESSARANAVMDLCLLGQYGAAIALADEQLLALSKAGVRQHEVVVQTYRAASLLELGQLEEALAAAERAQPLAEEIADHDHLCRLLVTRGRALQGLGEGQAATTVLTRALTLAQDLEFRLHERDAHRALSDVQEALGNLPAALMHLRAYLALQQAIHAQHVDRRTRLLTAQFQLEALRREADMERLRSEQLTRDNAALRQDHQLLAHRAAHDTLTGLANRAHFQAEVSRTLRRGADAGEGGMSAVLFIDLDGFKAVNDALGHDLGDELLRQVGARLRQHTRRGDLIARLGGDEFTVLLRELEEAQDATRVGEQLLGALCEPFTLDEHQVSVTASIGVAVAPADGSDLTTLQKHADAAMYRIKHSGKNGVGRFSGSFPGTDQRNPA